jgi:hypothetical protein
LRVVEALGAHFDQGVHISSLNLGLNNVFSHKFQRSKLPVQFVEFLNRLGLHPKLGELSIDLQQLLGRPLKSFELVCQVVWTERPTGRNGKPFDVLRAGREALRIFVGGGDLFDGARKNSSGLLLARLIFRERFVKSGLGVNSNCYCQSGTILPTTWSSSKPTWRRES